MQVADRQRQEFTKRPRMLHDSENGSRRTMPPEAAAAPIAMSAREIDFADDPFPNPRCVGGVCHFAHEFMAWGAGKTVVSALKLQVRGTDSGGEHPNPGESLWHAGQRNAAQLHAARFQMNG
jgi:hypothetical protein